VATVAQVSTTASTVPILEGQWQADTNATMGILGHGLNGFHVPLPSRADGWRNGQGGAAGSLMVLVSGRQESFIFNLSCNYARTGVKEIVDSKAPFRGRQTEETLC
jgi:hypothetical protein